MKINHKRSNHGLCIESFTCFMKTNRLNSLIMTDLNANKTHAENLLNILGEKGASDAEVLIVQNHSRGVSLRQSALEEAENSQSQHMSLRVYLGKKSATASFSFDPEYDYQSEIEDLLKTAEASPEDPYIGLPNKENISQTPDEDFDQYDSHELISLEEARARAEALNAFMQVKDLRAEQAGFSHSNSTLNYCASNGFSRHKRSSSAQQFAVMLHEGAIKTTDYAVDSKIYLSDLENIEATAERAIERAMSGRNPVRPSSGVFPVMFDERISSSLIGHLLSAMNAQALSHRSSWLIDHDEDILPPSWYLQETPFRKRRSTSASRDAEGRDKSEKLLIENGRPFGWISHQYTANQLDIPCSGHALRSGIKTSSGVASARLYGENIAKSELIKSMGEGLLVTSFIGATLNAFTGDYSRGASGFWIRNGKIAEAVNEVTIAGNLKSMLPTLKMADDYDEDKAMVIPSLLVNEMTIAGA